MAVSLPVKSINTVFQRVGLGASSKYEVEEDDDDGTTMEMVQIGAERTKNVLILMSDTGGGHRASAEAIRDAFQLEFGDEYRVILEFVKFFGFVFQGFVSCTCVVV